MRQAIVKTGPLRNFSVIDGTRWERNEKTRSEVRPACLLTASVEATGKTRNFDVRNKEQKHYKEKTLQIHEVNLCSEIPTKRTLKGYENLPYYWTRFPAAKIIECFNWTTPPGQVKGRIPLCMGWLQSKIGGVSRAHKRDGIGVGRIRTFLLSSDSAYDSVVYDLEKSRLLETEAEGEV